MTKIIYLENEFDKEGQNTGYYVVTTNPQDADAAIVQSDDGRAYNIAREVQRDLSQCFKEDMKGCNDQYENEYYIYGLRSLKMSSISAYAEPDIREVK